MGTVDFIKPTEIISKYNIDTFVETGSFKGRGIDIAIQAGFKEIYSTDISDIYYKLCLKTFENNKNVHLYKLDSPIFLENIKTNIQDSQCLFWLDAHLTELYDKSISNNIDIDIPLERELNILRTKHNIVNDFILIDDMRIYKDGPYTSGNCPKQYKLGNDIQFVYDIFGDSHIIEENYTDQGYIIIKPRT